MLFYTKQEVLDLKRVLSKKQYGTSLSGLLYLSESPVRDIGLVNLIWVFIEKNSNILSL